MLSRIAESLFWIGRYVERADSTARILDVHVHLLIEDPWADEREVCRSLLDVMGVSESAATAGGVDAETVAGVMDLLAYDTVSPASITSAPSAARENARGAREVVSSEMWECLNITWHALAERRAASARLGPHTFFRYVRDRAALFEGLTASTMSRDDGWRFLVLGQALESVDMTARLIATRAVTYGHSTTLTSLLRASGAQEPYLRAYRGRLDPAHVAEFLLLDRLFPGSALFALTVAEEQLTALAPDTGRLGTSDEARRALGSTRAMLEFRSADELLSDLPGHLDLLRGVAADVSSAISRQYFRQVALVQWERERLS